MLNLMNGAKKHEKQACSHGNQEKNICWHSLVIYLLFLSHNQENIQVEKEVSLSFFRLGPNAYTLEWINTSVNTSHVHFTNRDWLNQNQDYGMAR